MNKYNARRALGHASRKEYYRAVHLRKLQDQGLICDLREQVRYELLPAQRDAEGHLVERECSYVADFVYTDAATGATVVEDTKGFRTPEYVIKRKLMLHRYGIRIKET
jgi:Fe2+ or Zn2+ uptake regulation protein